MVQREFKCILCGKCCKKIKGLKIEQSLGLMMILPEERNLFPKKNIKPMLRYSKEYHPLPRKIWMFQIEAETCPHYNDRANCLIYHKRPTVCKAYPFEPTLNQVVIHEACPEVGRLKSEGYKINLPESYQPAVNKLFYYYVLNLRTNFIERYDLELKRWL